MRWSMYKRVTRGCPEGEQIRKLWEQCAGEEDFVYVPLTREQMEEKLLANSMVWII